MNINEKNVWLDTLTQKLIECFGKRLLLIAHVGSWARDDANINSDIDVNVILDTVTPMDLLKYRQIVSAMPNSELACGFLGSKAEMDIWPKYDLMAFYYGCEVLYGSVSGVIPMVSKTDIFDNVMIVLSGINHEARHSIIYDKDLKEAADAAKGLFKAAFFVIQGWYLLKQGKYIGKRSELLKKEITSEDALVLAKYISWDEAESDPMETLDALERWSSLMFNRMEKLNLQIK